MDITSELFIFVSTVHKAKLQDLSNFYFQSVLQIGTITLMYFLNLIL